MLSHERVYTHNQISMKWQRSRSRLSSVKDVATSGPSEERKNLKCARSARVLIGMFLEKNGKFKTDIPG
jgi:hypothetical protein